MTAEPAFTATILPCSETVATASSLDENVTDSVQSSGVRVKVMLKKRPASSKVTVGAESVRLVQLTPASSCAGSAVWSCCWSSSFMYRFSSGCADSAGCWTVAGSCSGCAGSAACTGASSVASRYSGDQPRRLNASSAPPSTAAPRITQRTIIVHLGMA